MRSVWSTSILLDFQMSTDLLIRFAMATVSKIFGSVTNSGVYYGLVQFRLMVWTSPKVLLLRKVNCSFGKKTESAKLVW